MNERPESEDGGIERLRAEVETLRGTLRRLECAGPPCGYRCPYCSHEPPLFNQFSAGLLGLSLSMFAFFAILALLG